MHTLPYRNWGFRHRRRAASLNDVQALVATLGGDSKVTAFYDTRYNVTAGGATVTAWDDARGASGYGPQLVGIGTTKPAWDATNKIITTDGSQNSLESAASTAFDLSLGRTLIYIGTVPAGNYPVAITDAGVTKYLTIATQSSTIRVFGTTNNPVTLGTVPGASRRLVMASFSPPNFFGAGVTPTAPQVIGLSQHYLGRRTLGSNYYQTGTATAGGWQLQLGHLSSYHDAIAIRAVIVLDHPATGDDWVAIRNWAATNHAFVADTPVSRLIFFDGNSLVIGQNSTAGNDYPSKVMASTGFTTDFDYVNSGIGSRRGATQLAAFPTRGAPAFAGQHTKKIYVCWELTNDINAGLTGAQAVANVQSLCQAAKAAGATACIAQTCIPNAGFSGSKETARLDANTLLRSLPSGIDAIADTAAIANLSNPANTTYYAADGVHLTDAGYALVATDPTYGVAAAVTPYI